VSVTDPPFNRTKCACENCIRCCKRQPGSLAAGDFERIRLYLQLTIEQAKKWFWASPGALAVDTSTGRTHRIGTITPRMRHGRCVFLDEHNRCTIHPVAPFGCAYFDTHMTGAAAHPRSVWLARTQLDDDYQKLRDELPMATSYKPTSY
jgi:Fe-S-cluster containining protein